MPTDPEGINPDEAVAEPTDVPTPETPVVYKAVIARKDEDIRKAARELANKTVSEEARKGSALNVLNWKRKLSYAFAGKAIRQKFIKRAEHAKRSSDNAYANVDVVQDKIVDAEADRASQNESEAATIASIKTQVETGTKLEGTTVEQANDAVRQLIVDQVVKPYINGEITGSVKEIEGKIQDRLTNLVRNYGKYSPEARKQIESIFGKNAVASKKLADAFVVKELLAVSDLVKQDVAAGRYALEKIQEHVEFQLANPSWAAESEVDLTKIDKIVAWVEERIPAGGFLLSPTFIGAAAGIAASTGEVLFTKAPSVIFRKVAPIIAPFLAPLLGGAVSAFKRNAELKQNIAQLRAESTYGTKTPTKDEIDANLAKKNAWERMMAKHSGEYRRLDLEKFQYDTALASDLRGAVDNLLSSDLTVQSNREDLIKAVVDIEARLNFSSRQKIDLITFESRGKVATGRMRLLEAMVLGKRALKDAGMADDEINNLHKTSLSERYSHFTKNKDQQDREFRIYRLKQSAGAFGFGATVGFASGIITQEGMALMARNFHWGEGGGVAGFFFRKGQTSLEKSFNWLTGKPDVGMTGAIETGGFNTGTLKNLYENPKNIPLSKDYTLAVGLDHQASILDSAGNKIPTPPINLTQEGHLIFQGKVDSLPDALKIFAANHNCDTALSHDTAFNMQDKFKKLIWDAKLTEPSKAHETFINGNNIVDVHAELSDDQLKAMGLPEGAKASISMLNYPTQTQVHGYITADGTVMFDPTSESNRVVSEAGWKSIGQELKVNGWETDQVLVKGKTETINLLDQFFKRAPEQMKALGVLETTQIPHTNAYDVLRPDVVSATGLHTHNELTFHAVGFRGYTGEPGVLSANGQIKGGLIPSWGVNYPGFGVLPDQADPSLDQINASVSKAFGRKLEWKDLAYIVRTSDGREVILPMDAVGHAKLPQEFWKVLPDNSVEYRGIDRMGYGVLQSGSNGPIISAREVFDNPDVLKKTSFLERWLASESFGNKPTTETVQIPDHNIFALKAPEACEIIPPAPKPENAPPLWFDTIPTRFQPIPPGVPGEVPPEVPPVAPPPTEETPPPITPAPPPGEVLRPPEETPPGELPPLKGKGKGRGERSRAVRRRKTAAEREAAARVEQDLAEVERRARGEASSASESSAEAETTTLPSETEVSDLELKALAEFASRKDPESREVYEESLDKVMEVLKGKDGIVEAEDLPTIVVPDIHGRREFLVAILDETVKDGPFKGQKVFDLLREGKINIVCVGDGMHTENSANWTDKSPQAVSAEITKSLGVMKMIMDLKTQFPENFHFIRGNHDDQLGVIGGQMKAGVLQNEVIANWMSTNCGPDFAKKWGEFEAALPLLVRAKGFVASHTNPMKELSEADIRARTKEAASSLTWDRVADDGGPDVARNALNKNLGNLSISPDTPWIVGHTPVTGVNEGRFDRPLGSDQLIILNNQTEFVYGYVPASSEGKFDPQSQTYKITDFDLSIVAETPKTPERTTLPASDTEMSEINNRLITSIQELSIADGKKMEIVKGLESDGVKVLYGEYIRSGLSADEIALIFTSSINTMKDITPDVMYAPPVGVSLDVLIKIDNLIDYHITKRYMGADRSMMTTLLTKLLSADNKLLALVESHSNPEVRESILTGIVIAANMEYHSRSV